MKPNPGRWRYSSPDISDPTGGEKIQVSSRFGEWSCSSCHHSIRRSIGRALGACSKNIVVLSSCLWKRARGQRLHSMPCAVWQWTLRKSNGKTMEMDFIHLPSYLFISLLAFAQEQGWNQPGRAAISPPVAVRENARLSIFALHFHDCNPEILLRSRKCPVPLYILLISYLVELKPVGFRSKGQGSVDAVLSMSPRWTVLDINLLLWTTAGINTGLGLYLSEKFSIQVQHNP